MKSTRKLTGIASMALFLSAVSLTLADVQVSKAFGDHMVLQQNQPIRVWGQADPGEHVTVEFVGQSGTAKAQTS